jgi:hypothetical protein
MQKSLRRNIRVNASKMLRRRRFFKFSKVGFTQVFTQVEVSCPEPILQLQRATKSNAHFQNKYYFSLLKKRSSLPTTLALYLTTCKLGSRRIGSLWSPSRDEILYPAHKCEQSSFIPGYKFS